MFPPRGRGFNPLQVLHHRTTNILTRHNLIILFIFCFFSFKFSFTIQLLTSLYFVYHNMWYSYSTSDKYHLKKHWIIFFFLAKCCKLAKNSPGWGGTIRHHQTSAKDVSFSKFIIIFKYLESFCACFPVTHSYKVSRCALVSNPALEPRQENL